MPDQATDAAQQSGSPAPGAGFAPSMLDSVFSDTPWEGLESHADEANDGDPASDQLATDGDPDQAGNGDAGDGDPLTPGDQATVEVEVNGKKVRVDPAVAALFEAQKADYKALQAEFTRRNQQPNPAEGTPKEGEGADEASIARRNEVIKGLDTQLYDALSDKDGEGSTELIMRIADARARTAAQNAVNEFVEREFKPLRDAIQASMGDTLFETEVSRAVGELTESGDVPASVDKSLVAQETKRIAAAEGKAPDREVFLRALMRVMSGQVKPSRGRAPAPAGNAPPANQLSSIRRPAAPNRVAPTPGGDGLPTGSPASRGVIHKSDDLGL